MEAGIRRGALPRPGAGRRASRADTVVLGRPAVAAAAVYSAAKAFRAAENDAVMCFWTGTGSVAWLAAADWWLLPPPIIASLFSLRPSVYGGVGQVVI